MTLEEANKLYQKVAPCLRSVEAAHDCEWGWLPKNEKFWRTFPEDEHYKYRLAKVDYEMEDGSFITEFKILVWEPKIQVRIKESMLPTFEEFISAYNLENLQ